MQLIMATSPAAFDVFGTSGLAVLPSFAVSSVSPEHTVGTGDTSFLAQETCLVCVFRVSLNVTKVLFSSIVIDVARGKLFILMEARLSALYKLESDYEILER